MASHFVSRHLVAGDLDSIALKTFGQVTTLQGINATITELQVHTVESRDIQVFVGFHSPQPRAEV